MAMRKLFLRVPGRFSSFLEIFWRFVEFMYLMCEYSDTSYFTMVILQIFCSEIERLLTERLSFHVNYITAILKLSISIEECK